MSRRRPPGTGHTVPMALSSEETDPILRESGPQKALTLYEQNDLTQADIAELLSVSQPTVARWLKAAREERDQRTQRAARTRERLGQAALVAMRIVFMACTLAFTAAVCWIAWGWPR